MARFDKDDDRMFGWFQSEDDVRYMCRFIVGIFDLLF